MEIETSQKWSVTCPQTPNFVTISRVVGEGEDSWEVEGKQVHIADLTDGQIREIGAMMIDAMLKKSRANRNVPREPTDASSQS